LVAGALLPAVLTGLWSGDPAHAVAAVRLLLSIPCGLMLARMTRADGARSFCAGAATGALAVAGLAMAQVHMPLPGLHVFTPPDATLWWYGDRLRATGIWSHPNELAQVQALGVAYALALGLTVRSAGAQICALAVALAVITLTFAATQTRAFLVVSALLTLCALLRLASAKGPAGRFAIAGLVLAAIAAAMMAAGDRFLKVTGGGQTLGDNLAERMATWAEAAALLLRSPGGYGFEGRLDAMAGATGALSATHNAFLGLGLTYGAGVAVAALCATLFAAVAPLLAERQGTPFGLAGLALMVLFLAEDSLFSGSMQVALSLAVFSLLAGRTQSDRRSAARGRPPRDAGARADPARPRLLPARLHRAYRSRPP
jgi:O-antigen ligase